ncbi:hypothetical protein JXL21_02000 [Candidatus Bathyarchaeota archaeon]|nr:hypothetical protein [Candidatus Bathyarchaeota archaeon]
MSNVEARRQVHFLLTVATALFVVSGLGISEFRLIETLTLGLLTKTRSFWLHSVLLYPFTALLFLHIYYAVAPRLRRNVKSSESGV